MSTFYGHLVSAQFSRHSTISKQVIDKGHSVVDIAKRPRIAEGVMYTLVAKFKIADEPESNDRKAMQAEESYYRQPANSQKKRGYRFYLNLLAKTKPVAIH